MAGWDLDSLLTLEDNWKCNYQISPGIGQKKNKIHNANSKDCSHSIKRPEQPIGEGHWINYINTVEEYKFSKIINMMIV